MAKSKTQQLREHVEGLRKAEELIEKCKPSDGQARALASLSFAIDHLDNQANKQEAAGQRIKSGDRKAGRPVSAWYAYVLLRWLEFPNWDSLVDDRERLRRARLIHDDIKEQGSQKILAEMVEFERGADGVERSTRIPTYKEVRTYLKQINGMFEDYRTPFEAFRAIVMRR